MPSLLPTFRKILEVFRVRALIGGLLISDSVIRLAVPSGGHWELYSQRLPAGVIEDGTIKDKVKFNEALLTLRKSSKNKSSRKKIPVVVSLSSSQIYTQAFLLPIVQESEAEKAITLNLKMISPIDYAEVYVGWQYLRKDNDTGRVEILSAFLRRSVADEIDQALEKANFRPLVLESRSLSLARFIRNVDFSVVYSLPRAVLLADDEGLSFLVMKGGQLYFEYTALWKNLYEPGKVITPEEFKVAVKRSVQQLVNFYGQRWTEPLVEFLIIAPSLAGEVQQVLEGDFSFKARELVFPQKKDIKSEWFGVIGATWRSLTVGPRDNELSLLGGPAKEKFIKERLIDFLALWSIIVPASLIVILLSLLAADLFIIREARYVETKIPSRFSAEDRAAMATLETEARAFNAAVSLVRGVATPSVLKISIIRDIFSRASSNNIDITNLRLQDNGALTLSGSAQSEDKIILLKNSLLSGGYQDIELPLSAIRKGSTGYAFSMTFSRITEKTP